MITSIPAALPAIAIASSGSPARNPPTLLEQGKSEHVVDHEPGRKRPGFLVPLAALSQDLIHQIGTHPLGEHSQPHIIS
jgi:hypothetical protein